MYICCPEDLVQQIDKALDFFEHIMGGEREAGSYISMFPQRLIGSCFGDAVMVFPTPRRAALAVFAIVHGWHKQINDENRRRMN